MDLTVTEKEHMMGGGGGCGDGKEPLGLTKRTTILTGTMNYRNHSVTGFETVPEDGDIFDIFLGDSIQVCFKGFVG
jgi:hypothetical protein